MIMNGGASARTQFKAHYCRSGPNSRHTTVGAVPIQGTRTVGAVPIQGTRTVGAVPLQGTRTVGAVPIQGTRLSRRWLAYRETAECEIATSRKSDRQYEALRTHVADIPLGTAEARQMGKHHKNTTDCIYDVTRTRAPTSLAVFGFENLSPCFCFQNRHTTTSVQMCTAN
jgi:hypothetical protein